MAYILVLLSLPLLLLGLARVGFFKKIIVKNIKSFKVKILKTTGGALKTIN
jgi:hypothetical protein